MVVATAAVPTRNLTEDSHPHDHDSHVRPPFLFLLTRVDHCMELQKEWHSVRTELEQEMIALNKDTSVVEGQKGTYKAEVFQGHCNAEKDSGAYLSMRKSSKFVSQLAKQLWGKKKKRDNQDAAVKK